MALKIKYQPLVALLRNPKNIRLHSPEQIDALSRSMREFGFTNPILVDADGVIIAGHGRLEAARILALDKVPTIELGHLSEQQRRAYAIADNKIPLSATWDMEALERELKALDLYGFDLSLTGFNTAELDSLLEDSDALIAAFSEPHEATPRTFTPVEQKEQATSEEEPEVDEPIREPRGSDRDYSTLEFVLEYSDKQLVIEALNNLRADRHYEKISDALVHLVKSYNEGKLDA